LLSSNSKVSVYCDQETDGGGWLVSSIAIQSNIYTELIIIIFVYCFQSSATKEWWIKMKSTSTKNTFCCWWARTPNYLQQPITGRTSQGRNISQESV